MKSRILVHDYAGHPFQVQLSRELARRGHEVLHAYSAAIVSPRGALLRSQDDSVNFNILPIGSGMKIDKAAYMRRYLQELRYGMQLASAINDFRADIVLSANTPLEAQSLALRAARKSGARFVFWLQDILSVGFERLLRSRLGLPGRIAALRFLMLERRLLRQSAHVVAISSDFLATLDRWGIARSSISVVENWASMSELPCRPRMNAWRTEMGLGEKFLFIYSGTLGLKHNPDLILQLALAMRDDPKAAVVVVSEGEAARYLAHRRAELGLKEKLLVLPFQPYERLPDVLASADVLVALLGSDAGAFSVPSKVLSYLCAGRPLLLSVPRANLAARTVESCRAGVIVAPEDDAGFLRAAAWLREDEGARARMASNALAHAERSFDIGRITDEFEAVFKAAKARHIP